MENIILGERRWHSKASEEYVSVVFRYPSQTVEWDIPILYRRTGVDFSNADQNDLERYVTLVYERCSPEHWSEFREEQTQFWKSRSSARVTRAFFDVLISSFEWKSTVSDFPPNPNFARRIQDIKELGYTLATNTRMRDRNTGQACTHLLLIPLPRGGITGYETWSPETRARIVRTLGAYDAFEGRQVRPESLLPDHKFPEIRWDDETRRSSLAEVTEDTIRADFQLITNQRNLQKREACRACHQSGMRGYPFGIKYFYSGQESWPAGVPERGRAAEAGCNGCGWYDLEEWRRSLNQAIDSTF